MRSERRRHSPPPATPPLAAESISLDADLCSSTRAAFVRHDSRRQPPRAIAGDFAPRRRFHAQETTLASSKLREATCVKARKASKYHRRLRRGQVEVIAVEAAEAPRARRRVKKRRFTTATLLRRLAPAGRGRRRPSALSRRKLLGEGKPDAPANRRGDAKRFRVFRGARRQRIGMGIIVVKSWPEAQSASPPPPAISAITMGQCRRIAGPPRRRRSPPPQADASMLTRPCASNRADQSASRGRRRSSS